MNIRQCATITDPKQGKGWRLVSREILLYLDPKTGEVVRSWKNPWTGETVPVLHVANDPVNQRPSFVTNPDGSPFDPVAAAGGAAFLHAVRGAVILQ